MLKRILPSVGVIVLVMLVFPVLAQESVPGDPCSPDDIIRMAGGPETSGIGYYMTCQGGVWTRITESDTSGNLGVRQAAPQAPLHVGGEAIIWSTGLACSGATEGALRYNSTDKNIEMCDGTDWTKIIAEQGSSPPTGSATDGYFVLTQSTYDGNLGGFAGADAKCLTELTTNTDWNGYADANARGLLVASKVKAFLCFAGNGQACGSSPMPLTTYYFARVGDSGVGGGFFTTDASGQGPGDFVMWSAANRFSGSYNYWSARGTWNADKWRTIAGGSSISYDCGNWTDNSSALNGYIGQSGYTTQERWGTYNTASCDTTLPLICMVDP